MYVERKKRFRQSYAPIAKVLSMPSLQVQLDGKSYAWTSTMDEAHILERAASSAASALLTAVAFGKFVLLVLLGVFFLYLQGDVLSILSLAFWMDASWSSLFLYAAMLCGVFLFSHQWHARQRTSIMPVAGNIPEPTPYEPGVSYVNLADVYSQEAKSAVERAFELAMKFGHARVEEIGRASCRERV